MTGRQIKVSQMQSKTNNRDKEIILKKFYDTFEANAQIISTAGGRAELIGGHTDYNEGFVIACAIDKSFSVAARARNDKIIIMFSDWANAVFEFELSSNLKPTKEAKWANYGIGAAANLESLHQRLSTRMGHLEQLCLGLRKRHHAALLLCRGVRIHKRSKSLYSMQQA